MAPEALKLYGKPPIIHYVTSQIVPSAREQEGRAKLVGLLRDFDPNNDAQCWRIRDLLATNPRGFYIGAAEILAKPEDSSGAHFLIALLSDSDFFIKSLCDPAMPLERALAIACVAAKRDPMIDVMLARYLTDRVDSISPTFCPVEFHRILSILPEISDGARILPFLMTLARQNNAQLRSKAVLLIGKVTRNVKWAQTRLAETDARVRANTIEALWGVDTPEVRELLRSAIPDTDNRVAGNALLGLYRLGDPSTIPELFKMASHESRRFRATAAWVMGETGDPRFVKALARMLGESNALVRTRAFSALGKVKAAALARAQAAGDWVATSEFGESQPSDPQRCAFLQIKSKSGAEIPTILGTQLTLTEDGEPVVDYVLEDRGSQEPKSLVFVFPWSEAPSRDPWGQAFQRCLAWKRPGDFWAVLYYSLGGPDPTEPGRLPPCPEDPLDLLLPPARAECPDTKAVIKRAAIAENPAAKGKRHLILVNEIQPDPKRTGFEQLLSVIKQSRSVVHVASTVAHPDLENLSQWSDGQFHLATTQDTLLPAILHVYLTLTARYSVRYKPALPNARKLTLSISCPTGSGETTVTS